MAGAALLFFLVVLCAPPFLSWAQRSAETVAEIEALTSFKLNLHDPLGALNGWDSTTPSAPCDWRGVGCTDNRVSELRLPRLELGGRLSDRLGNLRMLRKLSLRSNSFNGTVPSSLSQCTLLRSVFLQNNSLSGKLPAEIGNLSNLQIFNVASNHLSGEISGELPPRLKYLNLSSNSFSGEIPKSIVNLTGLQHFDPSDAELLEHLAAKCGVGNRKPHMFIDEFIPTLDGDNGIYYDHPANLPGSKNDGSSFHFFHKTINAYATGHRKRRKVDCHRSLAAEHVRWHKTGKTKPIMENGVQKGCKKIMVLYESSKKGSKADKSNWVMHQYHLGTEDGEKEGESGSA